MKMDLEYARKVIEAEADGIRSVAPVIDASFAEAAEMIYNCKGSVIVSGIGKAGIIGQKISATLASTGTPSHFLHPAEAVHGDLGRLRKGDIVIVLSYGGETDEVTRLINLVKQLEIQQDPLGVDHVAERDVGCPECGLVDLERLLCTRNKHAAVQVGLGGGVAVAVGGHLHPGD